MGTIAELQGKPDRLYPLLWLSNEGGSLEENYKIDNIRLTMFGRVIAGEEGQDDDASEIEVLSDMQLILLDFLNYFHQQHGQEYVTDKAATLEHFTERTNDRTAGYSCVLELKQFYDWNKCQIPESGASIPPTVDGLTLYDFCDQSVIDRLTPTQTACLAAEFGGAVVTEQINGVTIGTVAPGNTNNQVIQSALGTPVGTAANPSVIANGVIQVNGVNVGSSVAEGTYDQAIHDSAGSDVGTAANPSVVSDNTINFNGSDVDTVKAQETYTFTVELNSVQAGSYDAGTNKVSITSTNPSLAASVDDSTPDFGDTITITATPTDITPTSYTYVLPDGTTVTQAGSTYDWDVNVSGSQIIIVTATDGVSDVCGSVDVTIATIYVKHGITAAWEGKDAVIESDGQVDSNTDSTGNGNTATAPAAANRMIKYSDPRNTNNGMVGALGNSSTMRLGTSLSQLQSTITYFAVFDNIETGNTGVFNQHSLIGGDATPASNAGGRFDFRINTSTEAMFISVRQSSGATGAVINTATIAHGKNVVVMTYDGSNLRVNLNGTVQTAAWAGSLWTPASCNVVLMNSNISSYTAGCTSPYSVLGVKTSSLSDADADQLYDDLLIKYAG